MEGVLSSRAVVVEQTDDDPGHRWRRHRLAESPASRLEHAALPARSVPVGDLGVGAELLVVPRRHFAPVRDDVEGYILPPHSRLVWLLRRGRDPHWRVTW